MKLSGRQWWWAYLWHVVNLVVGVGLATIIAAFMGGGRWFLDGFAPTVVIFFALALFFAFVWPPIPKIELLIRALLRHRREARHAASFEGTERGIAARSGESPRQLGLHVPKRHIADRRRGEE